MTRDDAIAFVKMQALASEAPELSDDEVGAIVDQFPLKDKDGRAPIDPDWQGHYWVTKCVSAAWDRKLEKASQWVDVRTDGTRLDSNQAFQHLQRIADRWRRRCASGT